jgi:hypothetical protein
MKNKHIRTYGDFLLEQDMGMPMPGAPAPGTAPAKKITYPFIFMTGSEDAGNSRKKYPDGSIVIEYPSYSIEKEELKKWIQENIIDSKLAKPELEIRQANLENIVKGDKTNVSPEDLPFIEKLKNAVSANIVGKVEPDITVVFTKDVPTTEDVDVTFIKYKK